MVNLIYNRMRTFCQHYQLSYPLIARSNYHDVQQLTHSLHPLSFSSMSHQAQQHLSQPFPHHFRPE